MIRCQASGDQDTPCSMTNHSYFNLSGQGSGDVLDQEVQLLCSSYTLPSAVEGEPPPGDTVGEAAHHRPEIAAVGLVLLQADNIRPYIKSLI